MMCVFRVNLLKECSKARNRPEPEDLLKKAKKLELSLFREARSFEEYVDDSTLARRIKSVAMRTVMYHKLKRLSVGKRSQNSQSVAALLNEYTTTEPTAGRI
mmetsp:Transcript_34471/g.79566  ORF Transcript_34471/g.79566 Transcript_34471/m.79566 type:complete len:102 (+) Transcript_34471:144-449(+)